MIAAVADTHAAIWFLSGDSKLSTTARSFMEAAAQVDNQVGISAITLIEMVYLVEKGRIPAQRFTQLMRELDDPRSMFNEVSVNHQIARVLSQVNVLEIPDMPDRVLAATALFLNVPLISRDGRIQVSSIQTIW